MYMQKVIELYTSDLLALLYVCYKSIQKEKKVVVEMWVRIMEGP